MNRRIQLAAVALGLAITAPAGAQEMGQGEANITAQADVRMSLESGPRTDSEKLAQIGGLVGSKMGAIRHCYHEVTEERPTVQGEMRLTVDLASGGSVEVREDGVEDRELRRCILRELRELDLGSLRPPGSAYVVLTFSNSAAEGVEATQSRRAVEDDVTVTRNEDGRFQAEGRSGDGNVAFTVVGGRRATAEQVAALQRSMRQSIPVLLDCRRKASRLESPEGEILLRVQVSRRGRARVRVLRSTVPSARGGRCLTRFLPRRSFEAEAVGTHRVTIRFSHAEPTHTR